MQVPYKIEKGEMYIAEVIGNIQFGYYIEDYFEKFPKGPLLQDSVYIAIWQCTDEDLWEESKRDPYDDLDFDDEGGLTLLKICASEESIKDFFPRSLFLTEEEDERCDQAFHNVMETIDALMFKYHAKKVLK